MKKFILVSIIFLSAIFVSKQSSAQIDLENLDLKDIIGRVMNVQRGFAPKFSLGNIRIPKIPKVAEILGLKRNDQVNKLFNTFRTGRTIFQITSYAGSAVALYGVIKAAGDSASRANYRGALIGGLSSALTGVVVKLLTKVAAYKAVDIFNGIAARKIRDIFSIQPASNTMGIGLYVKLD
ncbi:MAG: hypothetical protein ACR2KX_14810 [Chitinophagaceae bacterium]